MKLQDFDFNLPKELIAYEPVYPRDSSRMLVLNGKEFSDQNFRDFLSYLTPDDLIIFNDTKVIAAKLSGRVKNRVYKINLHKKINANIWLAFTKKTKHLSIGEEVVFASNFRARINDINQGQLTLEFNYPNNDQLIEQYGQMPIPMYIKREANEQDNLDYQTIYANKLGSVAAPTAGLHFSQELFAEIKQKNIKYDFVTLHVGAGTFLPIKVDNIDDHQMHSEYCELSAATADLIKSTKKKGGRIIAIGTTSMRLLEYVAAKFNEVREYQGENDIFISPGFQFKIVDILLTNFHLPKSTLCILVSAFAGIQNIKSAYQHAIDQKYRFFSFGDCCLLYKEKYDDQ